MTQHTSQTIINLTAVIVAVTDDQPRVLIVEQQGAGLPNGPFDPLQHDSLESGLRQWVEAQTGLDLYYVEQLYTFGNRNRDPAELQGGPRVISVAYMALTHEDAVETPTAEWRDWYSFLPWEDWRSGRPRIVDSQIEPALNRWIEQAQSRNEKELRRERAVIAFGLDGATWDGDRVLERYEVLFETLQVGEALRPLNGGTDFRAVGGEMAFDHRRILATALGRIRAKIKYRPVIFELESETFTLLQLQRCVETLSGVQLHKQNFRRLVEGGGLVEGTGLRKQQTGGRPAALFRFRREVLLERPAPGVGLPGATR